MRQVLRIYQADDETIALEFSTSAADPLPYLKEGLRTDDQEIDIRECSATIGALTCELVDVPATPGDQDSGALTAVLADVNGETRWMGHRAEFLQEPHGGGALYSVFDGIVGGIELLDTLVTYRVTLEDVSARGRKVRLFGAHETMAMIPYGPVNGFGRIRDGAGDSFYAVQPAGVVSGRYTTVTATTGRLRLTWPLTRISQDIWEAALAQPRYADDGSFLRYVYSRVVVRWRANSADPWKTFRNIPAESQWPAAFKPTNADDPGADVLVWLGRDPDEIAPPALPANGQTVQVQVLYLGPPTDAFPLYFEGPAGEVLKTILDGAHSEEPPRIRYDAVRMAELATEVEDLFAEVREPAEDALAWLTEHWFSAFGYLRTIRNGKLYPVPLDMPDASPALVLDDSNVASARWSHDRSDAVTVVEYTFRRHDLSMPPVGLREAPPPGLLYRSQREVTQIFRSLSAATTGEQVVRLKPVTVREVVGTGWFGYGEFGTIVGRSVAQRRGLHLLDRLRFGAQRVTVKASRSDPAIDAANVGDWAVLGASWIPEYETLRRGANRLTQIVAARNLDQRWRELVLLDAGPDNQPLAQPTVGALVAHDDGTVEVPITAIPEGEAAVYYAVAAAQPPASSGLWLLASRITAPNTVVLPPAPEGATLHARVRAEAEGRIYSASVYSSIAIPIRPRVRDVRIELVDGRATVFWSPNASALGVRITYSVQPEIEDATFDQIADVDATAGAFQVPVEILSGSSIVARVTGYSGWNGSSVTGTAGDAEEAYASRGPTDQAYSLRNFRDVARTEDSVTFAGEYGTLVDEAWIWLRTVASDFNGSPWPEEGDAVTDILIEGVDPLEYTVDFPPPEFLTYLQAEPRWERADGTLGTGPIWRAVIHPGGVVVLTDATPVLDEDAGTLHLFPNLNAAAASFRYAVADTEAAARAAAAGGLLSTAQSVEAHTFTRDLEKKWIALVAYPETDGTGTPGPVHALPHTYHAANDRPSLTVIPRGSTDPTKVALRLAATDDGDLVAVYHRTYAKGSAPPAYTRSPAADFDPDPKVVDVLVTKPVAAAPNQVLEAYAEDDDGNTTARNLYLEVDPDGLGDQPMVEKAWDDDGITATAWLREIALGLRVLAVDWRLQVGHGPPTAWEASTRDEGDASVVMGGLLAAGDFEFDFLLDPGRFTTPEARLTLSNGRYVYATFPAFDPNTAPNFLEVTVDGTVVTMRTDTDGVSVRLERTDAVGWTRSADLGSDRRAVFDVSEESSAGAADAIGAGDNWEMDAIVFSEPVVEVVVNTPSEIRPILVSGGTFTPAAKWAANPTTSAPAIGSASIGLSMHANTLTGHDVEVWEKHAEPGGHWTELVRIDNTAGFTPDPNSVGNEPDGVLKNYVWGSGYSRRAKQTSADPVTRFEFVFKVVSTTTGKAADTFTDALSYYANPAA